MTGLSYEVIWFKQFSHVWGSSTLAMASVVGAFLLSLGIGSRVWGVVADRIERPVLWYGVCEIGIGFLALLIPWETNLLWQFSMRLYAGLRDMPACYALLRCAMTILVIGPACVLMGGTLPLLVRQRASVTGVGRAIGWLYGINTIGAALGCYLIGFHLLPEWGLFGSNVATAAANLAIGSAAVFVSRRTEPKVAPGLTTVDSRRHSTLKSALSLRTACGAAALTGFAALVLQTVWNRQLALVLGSSTYAFSAMLFVVLAGVGSGSLLFHRLLSRRADGGTAAVFVVTVLTLSAMVGACALPFVAERAGVAAPLRANYALNALVCIGGSAVVEFIPAVAMGALFPMLVQLTRQPASVAGSAVGLVYAWNTVGALAGTVGASVLIIPAWGTETAVAGAVLVYIVTALLVAHRADAHPLSLGALALTCAALVTFWLNPQDPQRTNLGMYLYGYRTLEQNASELLYFKEGTTSNVLVTRHGNLIALRVNGKVDGGNHGDMGMQLGLAYFPRFFNPDVKNVLVIGFGTGTTSGASLLFPATRVTCCEIEPAVVDAASHFEGVNHRPLSSPNFTIAYDDARAFVQGTDERFDLILSEPSNPWIAGVANLFTREFYELASRKLAPGGILAQWVQGYAFAPTDYVMIVRTLGDVFPHRRLIRISDSDTVLLASNEPLTREAAVYQAAQRLVDGSPVLQADLKRFFNTTDVVSLVLSRVVLDEPDLQSLTDDEGSADRNLDRDCRLEYRAARHMYEKRDATITRFLLAAARREWFTQQWERLGCDKRHIDALHEVILMLIDAGAGDEAAALLEFGFRLSPDSPALLVDELILRQPFDFEAMEKLLDHPDRSVAEHANRIGIHFVARKEFEMAVKVFERLCQRFPDSGLLWTNLANSYAAVGKREQAEQANRKALELEPVGGIQQ